MKIAVLGGAGAMGAVFGGRLAHAGYDVTLVDVNAAAIAHINAHGLIVEDKAGDRILAKPHATTDPASAGVQDYVLVFTKCYHTEDAVKAALPMIGPHTSVVSLQNGWGNAPKIQAIAGEDRVFCGVTYNSGALKGVGHALQGGAGMTYVGELSGGTSARVHTFAEALGKAGFEVSESDNVVREIWAKLALNACTLPTAAIFTWEARKLIEHQGMKDLMAALLGETVAVAHAQGIPMDYDERWAAIIRLLERIAPTLKGSMPTDIEHKRRTEIDVINGAIVEAGRRLGIPTPYNNTMVWLIKSLEETFGIEN
ncbi:MAG: 2-dehydropantoate 2-reductase [Anaerolineae bacterium]|nr:2-dehydropantoate 2-reductase [Candidatus Roseilinea sp.]MDW8450542.1 2-dehydropantoate 2-reductase [Anaerolineae bacterium]